MSNLHNNPTTAESPLNKTSLEVGFIHNSVIDNYLSKHESPEDMELYFCGPPLMNQAVQKMGEDFGIPDEHIRFDDFGG